MQSSHNKQNVTEEVHFGEKFTDVATKMKIQKHLNDINDTITEDDIRNIQLFNPAGNITHQSLSRLNSKEDGNNSPQIDTAWNIL